MILILKLFVMFQKYENLDLLIRFSYLSNYHKIFYVFFLFSLIF